MDEDMSVAWECFKEPGISGKWILARQKEAKKGFAWHAKKLDFILVGNEMLLKIFKQLYAIRSAFE